jgi:hypothetical protein
MTLPDRINFPVVLEGHGSTKEGYIIHECALIQSELQKEAFIDRFRNTNPTIVIKPFPFVLEAWDEGTTKKVLVDSQTMENDNHLKRFISKYSDYFLEVKPLKKRPINQPEKYIVKSHQVSLWWRNSRKSVIWSFTHVIIPILIGLLIIYLGFRFGWNK